MSKFTETWECRACKNQKFFCRIQIVASDDNLLEHLKGLIRLREEPGCLVRRYGMPGFVSAKWVRKPNHQGDHKIRTSACTYKCDVCAKEAPCRMQIVSRTDDGLESGLEECERIIQSTECICRESTSSWEKVRNRC